MSTRAPSRPPVLPGFEHRSLLGSGGFADVFLYEQERPQRLVAVKALLSSVSDPAVVHQFETEANVMASMSSHPSIVTIHQAVVADDGRPCIVMEYCSRPGYGTRFRAETIPVSEVLSVGIRLAGAVETAHRAGILHRDIKPANILVTEYGRPALTDFGIAAAIGEGGDVDDTAGMSIPWAPPETFADPPRADARSDVWSLAATLYSLLARRTPFEVPHGRNSAADLIHRIETTPLRPIERADIPASLARLLSAGMAKRPELRPSSALELGRALQHVEMELSLPVTSMDVLDERATESGPLPGDDPADAHTRIRAITIADPSSAEKAFPTGPAPEPSEEEPVARDRLDAVADTGRRPAPRDHRRPRESTSPTLRRAVEPTAPDEQPEESSASFVRRHRRLFAWAGSGVTVIAVVALAVGVVGWVRAAFPERTAAVPSATQSGYTVGAGAPAAVTALKAQVVPQRPGEIQKLVRLSWTRPAGSAVQDTYQIQWQISAPGYEKFQAPVQVKGRSAAVLEIPPNIGKPCATVTILREDSQDSPPAKVCVG